VTVGRSHRRYEPRSAPHNVGQSAVVAERTQTAVQIVGQNAPMARRHSDGTCNADRRRHPSRNPGNPEDHPPKSVGDPQRSGRDGCPASAGPRGGRREAAALASLGWLRRRWFGWVPAKPRCEPVGGSVRTSRPSRVRGESRVAPWWCSRCPRSVPCPGESQRQIGGIAPPSTAQRALARTVLWPTLATQHAAWSSTGPGGPCASLTSRPSRPATRADRPGTPRPPAGLEQGEVARSLEWASTREPVVREPCPTSARS
jgi:hypothetical protein